MIRNLPRDVEYQEFESSIWHQSIINIVLETCISIWLTSSWQLFNYGRINMTTFACQTWVVDRHQGHSRLLAISWARAHVWPLAINKAKNSRLDCSTNLRSVYVRASGRGIAAHFSFGYFKSNQVIFHSDVSFKKWLVKWVDPNEWPGCNAAIVTVQTYLMISSKIRSLQLWNYGNTYSR